MKEKTLDFDRFLSEKRAEYVRVRVMGREYRVKKEIPALLPLTLARAEEGGETAEMGRALLRAADTLFGRENVDALCRKGLSADDLTALVERTLALICGHEAKDKGVTLSDDGVAPEGERSAAGK